MDNWNPILAQTHIERVSPWKLIAAGAFWALGIGTFVFTLAVLILSLERVAG